METIGRIMVYLVVSAVLLDSATGFAVGIPGLEFLPTVLLLSVGIVIGAILATVARELFQSDR